MNKRRNLAHSYFDSIQFIHDEIQPRAKKKKTSKPWGA